MASTHFPRPSRTVRFVRLGLPAVLLFSLLWPAPACRRHPRVTIEEARRAWDADRFQDAARLYEQVLAQSRDPDGSAEGRVARFELADTYNFNLHDNRAAARHYAALLKALGPSDRSKQAFDARLRLAEVYARMGEFRDAINEYETLLLFFPDVPEKRALRATIAQLYYDRKDYDQARTEYLRVTTDVPFDALSEAAYQRVAGIDHHLRRKYEEAAATYQILIDKATDPKIRRTAQLDRAECLTQLLRFEDAADLLRSIPQTTPEEKADIRGRLKTIKQQRRELENHPEVNWKPTRR